MDLKERATALKKDIRNSRVMLTTGPTTSHLITVHTITITGQNADKDIANDTTMTRYGTTTPTTTAKTMTTTNNTRIEVAGDRITVRCRMMDVEESCTVRTNIRARTRVTPWNKVKMRSRHSHSRRLQKITKPAIN